MAASSPAQVKSQPAVVVTQTTSEPVPATSRPRSLSAVPFVPNEPPVVTQATRSGAADGLQQHETPAPPLRLTAPIAGSIPAPTGFDAKSRHDAAKAGFEGAPKRSGSVAAAAFNDTPSTTTKSATMPGRGAETTRPAPVNVMLDTPPTLPTFDKDNKIAQPLPPTDAAQPRRRDSAESVPLAPSLMRAVPILPNTDVPTALPLTPVLPRQHTH